MTKPEVLKLLMVIYAADRRSDTPGDAVVAAWQPLLWDVSFDEAVAAAGWHYDQGSGPITIQQLRKAVRTLRAVNRPEPTVAQRRGEPDADPDDVLAYIKALKEGRVKAVGAPVEGVLELEGVGKPVEPVGKLEGASGPRPRRWWLKFRKEDVPPEE